MVFLQVLKIIMSLVLDVFYPSNPSVSFPYFSDNEVYYLIASVCIVGPVVETIIYQFFISELLLKVGIKKIFVFVIVTGIFIYAHHKSGAVPMLMTVPSSIVFSYVYLKCRDRSKSLACVVVYFLHVSSNSNFAFLVLSHLYF